MWMAHKYPSVGKALRIIFVLLPPGREFDRDLATELPRQY